MVVIEKHFSLDSFCGNLTCKQKTSCSGGRECGEEAPGAPSLSTTPRSPDVTPRASLRRFKALRTREAAEDGRCSF